MKTIHINIPIMTLLLAMCWASNALAATASYYLDSTIKGTLSFSSLTPTVTPVKVTESSMGGHAGNANEHHNAVATGSGLTASTYEHADGNAASPWGWAWSSLQAREKLTFNNTVAQNMSINLSNVTNLFVNTSGYWSYAWVHFNYAVYFDNVLLNTLNPKSSHLNAYLYSANGRCLTTTCSIALNTTDTLNYYIGVGQHTFYIDPTVETSTTPIPGAVWLFGSGIAGLIGVSKRKKAANSEIQALAA